jgi:TIR domain
MENKVKIFFSYAREDEKLCEQLEAHLSFLKWQGLTIEWHRRNMSAGAEWEQESEAHLNTADIILLLISSDFMHSTYCYGREMKRAMERHDAREARVIPVLLRPAYWWTAPFSKLQALPPNGRPVMSTGWYSSDEAFEAIAQGICDVVEELTQKLSGSPITLIRKQNSFTESCSGC